MAWEKLVTARNELEAEMICGLLKSGGIPVQQKYKGIDQCLKIIMGPVVTVEIWVPAEHLAEAREMINSFSGHQNLL